MLPLESLKLPHERVELGIGNLRVLMDVVALFVMADLLAKFVQAGCRVHGQLMTY